MSDRHELQAAGTHPAPCARHCEATAFEIEIRRLRSEVTRLSSMIDHQRDEAIETERMLRTEFAASREREARMLALLQAADVLFAHHCQDCTAWNWLDNTRAALAEGAQG